MGHLTKDCLLDMRAPRSSGFLNKIRTIEDRIFTQRNLRFYGSGAAVASVLAVIIVWSGLSPGGWVGPHGKLSTIDFCWIWASGKLAVLGMGARVYEPGLFLSLHDTFFHTGECLITFKHLYVYPPTFLFFTYVLGLMPYLIACTVWVAATLALYEAAIGSIVPRREALILAIVPLPVLVNMDLGHNGFLTAGLMGLSLAFIERRPWLAGIFLGLLTYKPQFGVLFPLALLAARNWRVIVSATATAGIFGFAAAVAFGWRGWPSFVASLFDRTAGLSPDPSIGLRLDSIYSWLFYGAHISASISLSVQAAIAVAVAIWIYTAWARSVPYPMKAASLALGSLIVTPYVFYYDLCILSVAVALLIKDGLARGFLPGERFVILACFASLTLVTVPLAPVICAVLMCLAARRICAWGSGPAAMPPEMASA